MTAPQQPTWSAYISGSCVVCIERLDYTVTTEGGIPEVKPNGDYVAYRGGHMCRRCGDLVAAMVTAARSHLKRDR